VDISTIQGADAVGSLVTFVDGKPRKSEYRHFRIRTVVGQDDFAMLREVVVRHYTRLTESGAGPPDLLLVDGGVGQLRAVESALEAAGHPDQAVAALAKRLEEVFLPDLSDPQTIPKTSSTLRLFQAVRDEAHRFAVTYHRKLRQRRTLTSDLDAIPGVGAARKKALLRAFGSVRGLREASPEAIAGVEGIGPRLAGAIATTLGADGSSDVGSDAASGGASG
jgi:excinuclease ABC subunit C